MKKMVAGKFKAASGESGARDGQESGLFGFMRGEFKIIRDIESPYSRRSVGRRLRSDSDRILNRRAPSHCRRGGAGDAGGSETRPYWRRFEGGMMPRSAQERRTLYGRGMR